MPLIFILRGTYVYITVAHNGICRLNTVRVIYALYLQLSTAGAATHTSGLTRKATASFAILIYKLRSCELTT